MKKKNLTLIYILINILIVVLIGIFDPHLKDIWKALYTIRLPWLFIAFSFMVLYWVCDAFITYYSVAVTYRPAKFGQCFKVTMIGQYYNSVTPFASGGQPAQIYYMTKAGIPAGYGSSALMIKFLIYQLVLSVYSLIAFIALGKFMHHYSTVVFWISLIGFIVNAGAIFLIYFLATNKTIIKKFVYKTIELLNKMHIVKDIEHMRTRIISHVEDFHRSSELMKNNFKAIIIMSLITSLQLTFFFSITYFIYKAFGLSEDKWIDIIFIQSFLYLAVCYFPTPGSSGASEGGFYIFFQLIFPRNFIFVAMLFWRLISYYMNIIVGGLVIFADSIHGLYRRHSIKERIKTDKSKLDIKRKNE